MTGQAEDKECSPGTTVKALPEEISKFMTVAAKEENHSMPEKSSPQQTDEQEAPSRHLWVGNVSTSVTEAELAEQFSRFGDIESVTTYPSRNYAFVNFKTVEDGLYAKKGLQGTVLGGLAIRIEFAKGAKPSKHLWIGNIFGSVTKEQLEAECEKFGVVDDVRILRDRNCAFVDFTKTDDAIAAFENLNKKIFGADELCVEYVKSQLHPKKDSGQPRSDERSTVQDEGSGAACSVKTIPEKPKRDRDEPSEILWVGFPICMKVDERKLHKAFAPFGGIERITTFPGRTYAFVQFHSIKAATRAKNVLQGKLFNDPRVSISFAKSEIGPVDQHPRGTAGSWMPPPSANANMPPLLFSKPAGFANPRNDRFFSLNSFGPHSPSFRRRPEGDMDEASMFFEHHEPGFRDDMFRGMRPGPDLNPWGSPALPEGAFIHPRHAPHIQERWNFEEEALGRREPKRPRAAGSLSGREALVELRSPDARDDREAFQVVKAQDYISKFTRMSNSDKVSQDNWEDTEGLKRPAKRSTLSMDTVIPRLPSKDNWVPSGMSVGHLKEGFQWQGVIAKSGTSVCRARCFSIGKTADFIFPEVVNCTARTSLDMLAKHISEVGEFSLVSFIPHGDVDVESYQDFVIYLSEKNRAAVCKLSQEATLFLVPPSSFVEHFLKVPSQDIVGVVLKLPQAFSSSAEQTGLFQPMQTGLLSASGLHAEGYQRSTSQAPEHKLPAMAPMQAAFHGMPLTEVMTSHPLLPSHYSSLQTSSPAGPNYAGVSSAGGVNGSSVRPNPPSHGAIMDGSRSPQMHLPPGYASLLQQQQQQQQHSTSQMGSFSLAQPAGDLHPHQEQGMRINASLPILASYQASSTSGHYPTTQSQNNQSKNIGQSLSSSTTYPQQPQQPPLPQYPHPSTQQNHPSQPARVTVPNVPPTHLDQFSHLTSLKTTQLQPFPDNVQPIVQPPQHASDSHLHQHHSQQQMTPASNFVPDKEQWSTTASQSLHPPHVNQEDDSRRQTTAVDAEQSELLRLAQQKLSEVKGESGEDNKRFQATLELAAALLQQLQHRAK